jgi:hypothetical protein
MLTTHARTTDTIRFSTHGPSVEERQRHAARVAARNARTRDCSCTRDQNGGNGGENGGEMETLLTIFNFMRNLDARLTALEQAEQGEARNNGERRNGGGNGRNNGGGATHNAEIDPDTGRRYPPTPPDVLAAQRRQSAEARTLAEDPFHYDDGTPIPQHEGDARKLGGGGPYAGTTEPTPLHRSEADPFNSEALRDGPKGALKRDDESYDWTIPPGATKDQLQFLLPMAGLAAGLGSSFIHKIASEAGTDDQLLETLGSLAQGLPAAAGFLAANALFGRKDNNDQAPSNAPKVTDPRIQQQGVGGDATTRARTTDGGGRKNRAMQMIALRHRYDVNNVKTLAQMQRHVIERQQREAEFARNRRAHAQAAAPYRKDV